MYIRSIFISLILSLSFIANAEISEPVLVGFVSNESQDFYEKVVKPYWQRISNGSTIELISLTPYTRMGEIDLEQLALNIQNAPASMKSIYVQWNEKYDPKHAEWLASLRGRTDKGARVAFFAGLAKPGARTVPLGQTLASQVPKALILGELVERERLSPQHYYGPELFSAFQVSALGSAPGLAPLTFVSRWAIQSLNTDLDQSLYELRKRKLKSLRLWPTTEDFFGK